MKQKKENQETENLKDINKEECATQQNEAGTTEDVSTEEESSASEAEKAQEEIAKLKDQLLRNMAEFENYRKRTIKEKSDLILNGGAKVISSLLPIVDDLERAIKNTEESIEDSSLVEGLHLIYKKFMGILEKQGLKAIDTDNQDFDVDKHEAIAMVPAGEEKKGMIIDCVLKGYTLNDKVIRHAKVAVGQ